MKYLLIAVVTLTTFGCGMSKPEARVVTTFTHVEIVTIGEYRCVSNTAGGLWCEKLK